MTSFRPAEFEEESELEALRRALAATQRQLKQAKAKSADLIAAVHQAAREAALIMGTPPKVPAPRSDRRSRKAETAMLLCSDWHIGKASSSFSTDVALKRLALLGEKVAQITEVERADHPVRECHCLMAGDMADNTAIFPGHVFEVDSTAFEQVFAAALAAERLIRHLLGTFQSVHVWEQLGNHGRIGRKGDYARTDNLDLLIYRLCRDRLSTYERKGRLVWHPATTWHSIVAVGNYRALLIHGDQIKSFGGNTPAFGILRKANAWASGVLDPFTDMYLGHFHQALALPLANGRGHVYVNPSIESDSAYAKEFVAATGTPGQRLNFVEPDKGRVTSQRVLWLDEV